MSTTDNETRYNNLLKNLEATRVEMLAVQLRFTDMEGLTVGGMLTDRKRYEDLQTLFMFLSTMKDQLFPSKIVKPTNGASPLKFVN